MKCKITLKEQSMNKSVNFLGTGEKQWGYEFLPCGFSSRNKTNN